MEWFRDRWADLSGLGSAGWLTIAAWAGLALGLSALLFTARALKRNRLIKSDELRPHVVVYMEPHPADWHVIELVVRNFGKSAAHNIRFEFTHPLTVGRYEDTREDGLPEIAELRLPSELTQLAPGQEWRTVWDSAIRSRRVSAGRSGPGSRARCGTGTGPPGARVVSSMPTWCWIGRRCSRCSASS